MLFGVLAVVAVAAVVTARASYGSSSSAAVASDWSLPNADLQNTRDVAGPITSANVGTLKKAWTVKIRGAGTFGTYATTPVVVDGVVYTQDIDSNVYAIDLQTGKVEWFKKYNSPSVGPNGVTVANGVVYGATSNRVFAIQASTGEQLWLKKLTRNANEGIDMAPGYNNGTIYVSTVPGNSKGFYVGNGQSILWAMDAKTGAVKWKWDEVPKDLWSKKYTSVNSGGGQWDPPAFDANGDLYVGVSNPAPFPGTTLKKKGKSITLAFGSSRPGKNLYTDSVVKLDHNTGKLVWYYQLTPHDINDWDMENSPILTTANGKNIVVDGGKAGIVIGLDAQTGKLLWKRPVGKHNGHDHDGLLTLARAKAKLKYPYTVFPGILGGVESELATDGTNAYAVANNLATTFTGPTEADAKFGSFAKGTGDFVAINLATGKVVWDHKLHQSPYGAVSITNDVAFTTTFDGTVWALSTKTGAVLWHVKLPAGTNAPVAISGNTLLAAASFPQTKSQHPVIVAYRLP
jgi:outer membrane protein assembly factor BamB